MSTKNVVAEKFMDFDEIVHDMISKMTPTDRASWLNVKREDLIGGHHTVGQAIRNFYMLWDKNNPIALAANPQKHPDDVSMEIIEAVWDKLESIKLPEMPLHLHTPLAS